MTVSALRYPAADGVFARKLVAAGLTTAVVDGCFATIFNSVVKGNLSLTRVWLGVASAIAGKGALDGGLSYVGLGILMHITVAFTWSCILLLMLRRSLTLRRILESPFGPLKIGVVYGPLIWTVMSWIVVPSLVHRFPALTMTWFAMWVGHMFFVGLPMATAIKRA